MDTTNITVALLVILCLGVVLVFRSRIKISLGKLLRLEGSNQPDAPAPGVRAKGVRSEAGGLTARDGTGRGVEVEAVQVKKDVQLTNEPGSGGSADPKG